MKHSLNLEQAIKNKPTTSPKKSSDIEIYLRSVKQDEGRGRNRELVRMRDNHTCQDCGFKRLTQDVQKHNKNIKTLKGRIKSLDIHHTNGLCGKNSKGYDFKKGFKDMVTLCHRCHFNRPEHTTKLTKR